MQGPFEKSQCILDNDTATLSLVHAICNHPIVQSSFLFI